MSAFLIGNRELHYHRERVARRLDLTNGGLKKPSEQQLHVSLVTDETRARPRMAITVTR
jgi:hypothetical protein